MDNQLRNRRLLVGGIAALLLFYGGYRQFRHHDNRPGISIHSRDDADDKSDEKTPFQVDVDNKTGGISVKSKLGSADVKIPGLANRDMGNLDFEGIKLYPGAKMAHMQVKADGDNEEGRVEFTFDAPAAAQSVHDYYANALREKGFEVTGDVNTLRAHKDDEKAFELKLSGSGNATHGVVTIKDAD